MQNIVVKNSKIHKKGVFADKDFKKGEKVLKWNPLKILNKEDVDKLPESEKHYVANYKSGEFILQGKPERYVNHSCSPNTKVKNRADIAIESIKKGEEITSDYSDGILQIHFECHCGCKNCKKVI